MVELLEIVKFKILTIFPEFFERSLDFSLLKKAKERGVIDFEIRNIRDFAKPKTVHMMTDDRPYGGGPGMVMMIEPMYKALKAVVDPELKRLGKSRTIIFSPKGSQYTQPTAEFLANEVEEIVLIAPHYEGFDERILNYIDMELSVGDYVLTGGEIPALLVIDSVARLIPGVVGNGESVKSESFSRLNEGIRNLEHAQYTRPEVFVDDEGNEYRVPDVLLSGKHREIEKWREGKLL